MRTDCRSCLFYQLPHPGNHCFSFDEKPTDKVCHGHSQFLGQRPTYAVECLINDAIASPEINNK
jgi:hypothetical protein